MGFNAGLNLTTGSNNIALGHLGVAEDANTIWLRNSSHTRAFLAGINGATVGSSTMVLINSSGQVGTLVSSARYKHDIHAMGAQSQKLRHLRPVTFQYTHDPQGELQYGLIAEEVAEVYPELVTTGAEGQVEAVQYHALIPMLLNEFQQQQQQIEAQAQQLRVQAQEITALTARVERLEAGAASPAPLAQR